MDLIGNRPLEIEFALSILYYGGKNDNSTPWVRSHAECMAGEDSTAVASTAEQSVNSVERWSVREEHKRRQFEEEQHESAASPSLEESSLLRMVDP